MSRGAVDACVKTGCEDILRWDIEETAKGGPFDEIVESDMYVPSFHVSIRHCGNTNSSSFINCIYLNEKIAPFVDLESLKSPKRKLSVVCDVVWLSCSF